MIHQFTYNSTNFSFCVENQQDTIQSCFVGGFFYEVTELEFMKHYIPENGLIIDVGANVGNHSVFFATQAVNPTIICFEPNPIALKMLYQNVSLNNLSNIDLSNCGIGLGRRSEEKPLICVQKNNLGSTFLDFSGNHQSNLSDFIEIKRLDDCIAPHSKIDFMKIDVEGMELDVLEGAIRTIESYRPVIFIEVGKKNMQHFTRWCDICDYRIEKTFIRYRNIYNFLCISKI